MGIDLVSVQDIRNSVDAFGERYLERVFSPRELAGATSTAADARRLAACFAAKEATFKVLRLGRSDPTAWRDVEVLTDPVGGARLSLSGTAANLAASAGIRGLTVSLSHCRGCAAAVVIAEDVPSDR